MAMEFAMKQGRGRSVAVQIAFGSDVGIQIEVETARKSTPTKSKGFGSKKLVGVIECPRLLHFCSAIWKITCAAIDMTKPMAQKKSNSGRFNASKQKL